MNKKYKMIAYLKGTIQNVQSDHIVVDVHDVGYKVFIPQHLIGSFTTGDTVALDIYTQVTENSFSLFGFMQKEELLFFKMLISVSGIGPKSAMNILSVSYNDIVQAILEEDMVFMQKLPGVGKKTAERIIVELKSKLSDEGLDIGRLTAKKLPNDALEALLRLGFTRKEAVQRLEQINTDQPIEEIIKQALN